MIDGTGEGLQETNKCRRIRAGGPKFCGSVFIFFFPAGSSVLQFGRSPVTQTLVHAEPVL